MLAIVVAATEAQFFHPSKYGVGLLTVTHPLLGLKLTRFAAVCRS